MIQLPEIALPPDIAAALASYQRDVDGAPSYPDQVARGKRLFSRYNTRDNETFLAVKQSLDAMCAGAKRCAYCEDSMADEVEHVRPKDLYPQVVFAWANYIYACGPCNGPKGSHYAVFVGGSDEATDVARKPKAAVVPPLDGDHVLIDPRREDAMRWMMLELRQTFHFVALGDKGSREHERAKYTIKTLHLNDRDALPRARFAAYKDYVAHVRRYQHDRDAKAPASQLAELVGFIRARQHPTVWREMKRQREQLAELTALFADVPEAVGW